MKFWFGQKSKEPEAPTPASEATKPAAETAAPAASAASATPAVEPVLSRPAVPSVLKPNPALAAARAAAAASVAVAPAAAAPVQTTETSSPAPAAAPASVVTPIATPKPGAPTQNPRAMFRELINGLYDVILILDNGGRIISSNKRAETVLGYTDDDLWDIDVTKIVHGVNALIFKQMRDALHNSQQVLLNARCFRKDGTDFIAEVSASLVHLTREENLVFLIRNTERRIAAIREQVAKELRPKYPEAAAMILPQAKVVGAVKPRVVVKKAAPATAGA